MYDYKGRLMNARVNAFYFPGLLSALSITASMFLDIAIVGQMLGSVAMGAVNLALPLTMAICYWELAVKCWFQPPRALVISRRPIRCFR